MVGMAGQRHGAESLDPHLLYGGENLAYGPADEGFPFQAGLHLERFVDFKETVIDRFAARVADHLVQGEAVQHLGEEGPVLLLAFQEQYLVSVALPKQDSAEDDEQHLDHHGAGNDVDFAPAVGGEELAFFCPDVEDADGFSVSVPDRVVGGEIGNVEDRCFATVRAVCLENGIMGRPGEFGADSTGAVRCEHVCGYPRVPHENGRGPAEDLPDLVGEVMISVDGVVARHEPAVNDPEIGPFGPDELPKGLDRFFLVLFHQMERVVAYLDKVQAGAENNGEGDDEGVSKEEVDPGFHRVNSFKGAGRATLLTQLLPALRFANML